MESGGDLRLAAGLKSKVKKQKSKLWNRLAAMVFNEIKELERFHTGIWLVTQALTS
jgi:hypothetical protein